MRMFVLGVLEVLVLKNLECLGYNNYIGKILWKYREIFEKGNCIYFNCILFFGFLLQDQNKYFQIQKREGRWKGR